MNLFDIPDGDRSYLILSQLFGRIGNVLVPPIGAAGSLIMRELFQVINTSVLVLGAIFLTYITVVGLIKTASEGEFLGKQWNSVWVPVRTVMGIASLVPTASGYSILQVIFMWVILQGVGAADQLWNTVINFWLVTKNITAGSVNTSPANASAVKTAMTDLMKSMICEQSLLQKSDLTYGQTNSKYFYCANSNSPFCTNPPTSLMCTHPTFPSQWCVLEPGVFGQKVDAVLEKFGPNGACGNIVYCNQDSNTMLGACGSGMPGSGGTQNWLMCSTCKVQNQILATIVNTLGRAASNTNTVAKTFANVDQQYLRYSTSNDYFPSFVRDYCAANKIPDICCKRNNSSISAESQSESTITSYARDCNQQNSFPTAQDYCGKCFPNFPLPANLQISGREDYGNASLQSIKEIYIPYAMTSLKNYEKVIDLVTEDYNNAMQNVLSTWVKEQSKRFSQVPDDMRQGWIMAGGYYRRLARQNDQAQQWSAPILKVTGPDPENSQLTGVRNNIMAADKFLSYLENPNASDSDVSQAKDQAKQAFFTSGKTISAAFGASIQATGEDELLKLHQEGITYIANAMYLLTALITVIGILGIVGAIAAFQALGSGPTAAIILMIAQLTVALVMPVVTIYVTWSFVTGGLLAYYIPLIPFMLFTMGAVGWCVACIEAMVAAPIVALGILSPGGQHDLFGRAEPGFMLLLNLFLRPTLMIFGLIAGLVLISLIIPLVNTTFSDTRIQDASGESFAQLVELIILITVRTMIIASVVAKCFSTIYIIPERILTWIGGAPVSYGEQEVLQAAKGGVESAAGQAAKAGLGTAQGAGAGMKNKPKTKEEPESASVSGEGAGKGKEGEDKGKDGSLGGGGAPPVA